MLLEAPKLSQEGCIWSLLMGLILKYSLWPAFCHEMVCWNLSTWTRIWFRCVAFLGASKAEVQSILVYTVSGVVLWKWLMIIMRLIYIYRSKSTNFSAFLFFYLHYINQLDFLLVKQCIVKQWLVIKISKSHLDEQLVVTLAMD